MARFQTDPLIRTAAAALAAGDPLAALNCVALRDDAPALALRGIAMAQLGDLAKARTLLRRAARAFGLKAAVSRARCVLAEAEIALASRELGRSARALAEARAALERGGDRANAALARLLEVRRLVLIGRLHETGNLLEGLNPARLPPALRASYELVIAGIALRQLRTKAARTALARAKRAARMARIPALTAEVENAAHVLTRPAAKLRQSGKERLLRLADVEKLLASDTFVVDACRNVVRQAGTLVLLARRPVVFALVRTLAEAWPGDVPRSTLITQAFQARQINESHRARLRVEIGRLRQKLKPLAGVSATMRGFVLVPRRTREVAVLGWPGAEAHAAVLAFLADGESWSSSALATALGASQRTVQRSLDSLAAAGKVQAFGRGRARRWLTSPVPGLTTLLLLPAAVPLE